MKLLPKLIITMMLVSIIPLIVSGYFAIEISQKEVIKQIEDLHLESARGISDYINRYLQDLVKNLRLGTSYIKFAHLTDGEKVGALRILYSQFPSIAIATLLNEKGEGVVPSVYLENPGEAGGEIAKHQAVTRGELDEYIRRIPFAAAMESGAAISPVYVSPRTGIPLVALGLAFPADTAGTKWVFSSEISLGEIQDRIAHFSAGLRGYAFLVDDQGRIICHPDKKMVLERKYVTGLGFIDRFVGGKTRGVGQFTGDGGARMIGAYSPVESTGWGVVVAEPLEDAFVSARKMRDQNLYWVGVGMALAIISGMLFSRSLTNPVKKLAQGAMEMARGKFDRTIAVTSRDEIGQLSQNFNYMGSELKKAMDEIKRWNVELQDRVEERTRELKETQDQLLQAQKMAAIGELGGGVAHELNNPLVGILGFTQLLLMTKDEKDEDRRSLQLIEKEALRCKEIVHNLLVFSQKEKGVGLANVNINRILEGTLSLLENQLVSQKILLSKDFDPSLPEIKGDSAQIQQVFMHVISNARNAMARGGELRISTRSENRRLVIVRVSDTGKGIPKENLDRIFEPFFTTKDDWQAKGLGLTVSYRIVTEHKGKIMVSSEVGKGTTVTITFPAIVRTQLV